MHQRREGDLQHARVLQQAGAHLPDPAGGRRGRVRARAGRQAGGRPRGHDRDGRRAGHQVNTCTISPYLLYWLICEDHRHLNYKASVSAHISVSKFFVLSTK